MALLHNFHRRHPRKQVQFMRYIKLLSIIKVAAFPFILVTFARKRELHLFIHTSKSSSTEHTYNIRKAGGSCHKSGSYNASKRSIVKSVKIEILSWNYVIKWEMHKGSSYKRLTHPNQFRIIVSFFYFYILLLIYKRCRFP